MKYSANVKNTVRAFFVSSLLVGALTSPSYSFERNVPPIDVYEKLGLRSYVDLAIGETTGVFSGNFCWENNSIFLIASSPIDEFAIRISVRRLDDTSVEMTIKELPTEDQTNTLKRHFISIFNGFSCEGVRFIFSPTPKFLEVKNINGFGNFKDLLESIR